MVRCKKILDIHGAVHINTAIITGRRLERAAALTQRLKMSVTTPNFEEFQSYSKKQLEALTNASQTWTKGLQEIATESTDYSKKAFAAGSAAFEKLSTARSLESAMQIQSDYAKQAYEGFVAQASKFSELYSKVASDALKPVTTAYAALQK
jgi:hypothetical protein